MPAPEGVAWTKRRERSENERSAESKFRQGSGEQLLFAAQCSALYFVLRARGRSRSMELAAAVFVPRGDIRGRNASCAGVRGGVVVVVFGEVDGELRLTLPQL